MYTVDSVIDTVQNGKKQMVNTFVTNTDVASALNQFIDNQTEYTKQAVKATTDAMTTVSQATVKAVQDASRFDYTKFGEGIMKAYQSNLSAK